jgi:hypothetical protein
MRSLPACLLLAPAALAQLIPLWPDRSDQSESLIGPNDTAILIAPGGAFRHLAID